MIEVNSVTKRYGGITALDDFSFSLGGGDIVGFIGPNGAGKSTMMKIITGCLAPSEGSVVTDGFDMSENPVEAKALIGYLPEQPPLYPSFTVYEYLSTVYYIKGIRGDKKQRIAEVCEICGLAEVKKRKIGNLSKGYCQRAGLAQAILAYPPYLVLDEPTSGLDPVQKKEMLSLVKKLGKRSGIILSSHILSEIDSVCNKILMINNGRLISYGGKDELGTSAEASKAVRIFEYTVLSSKNDFLRAVSGIEKIRKTEAAEKDGKTVALITADGDIRERVFERLSKNALPILSCTEKGNELENVFFGMTEKSKVKKSKESGGRR